MNCEAVWSAGDQTTKFKLNGAISYDFFMKMEKSKKHFRSLLEGNKNIMTKHQKKRNRNVEYENIEIEELEMCRSQVKKA